MMNRCWKLWTVCWLGIGLLAGSCVREERNDRTEKGELWLSMDGIGQLEEWVKRQSATLDTNAFLLRIAAVGSDGPPVYQGLYGQRPASLVLDPGAYEVEVLSAIFQEPAYAAPQYGDQQVAVVSAGSSIGVKLWAHVLNAGIRFLFTEPFLTLYAGWTLHLCSEAGSLDYSLRESRIAYFHPGRLVLSLRRGEDSLALGSRWLEQGQVLTLTVSSTEPVEDAPYGFSIHVDTTRIWVWDELNLGDIHDGSSPQSALTVTELPDHVGSKDVWVEGYVVGGDLTSSTVRFDPPFEKMTSLALAATPTVRERSACVAVELKSGKVREALNLVDHPELYGKRLLLRGDIVASYYGLVGVKSISEWIYE